MSFAIALLAGAAAGALSAWGIGGGTLLVLYITCFTELGQRAAQGINLLYFLPTAALALTGHIKNKLIDRWAVLPSVATGVPAAIAASYIAAGVEIDALRRAFGIFVIAVGVFELFAPTSRPASHR
ncbi:MAG: TSUP family transporter [Oscillospiraceae bacterium]|jgi:uncharacterized membrane protein YfcA|nr:TSUP family transporter [Oscillospiraceae bacterium]